MDVSSIARASTAISQAKTGDAITIAVLRKALDIEAQSALLLIQALPALTTNSPPSLGNSVNVFA